MASSATDISVSPSLETVDFESIPYFSPRSLKRSGITWEDPTPLPTLTSMIEDQTTEILSREESLQRFAKVRSTPKKAPLYSPLAMEIYPDREPTRVSDWIAEGKYFRARINYLNGESARALCPLAPGSSYVGRVVDGVSCVYGWDMAEKVNAWKEGPSTCDRGEVELWGTTFQVSLSGDLSTSLVVNDDGERIVCGTVECLKASSREVFKVNTRPPNCQRLSDVLHWICGMNYFKVSLYYREPGSYPNTDLMCGSSYVGRWIGSKFEFFGWSRSERRQVLRQCECNLPPSEGSISVWGEKFFINSDGELFSGTLCGRATPMTLDAQEVEEITPYPTAESFAFDGSSVRQWTTYMCTTNEWTFTAWIQPEITPDTDSYTIIHSRSTIVNASSYWFDIVLDYAGNLNIRQHAVGRFPMLWDRKWHHLACVYTKESGCRVLLDGKFVYSVFMSHDVMCGSVEICLGGRMARDGEISSPYRGLIADAYVVKKAFFDTEIIAMARLGLRAVWCDEASQGTVTLQSVEGIPHSLDVDYTDECFTTIDIDGISALLAGGSDGTTRLYKAGEFVREYACGGPPSDEGNAVVDLLVVRESLFTAHADGVLRQWNLRNGSPTSEVRAHPTTLIALRYSLEQDSLITADRSEVKVWKYDATLPPSCASSYPVSNGDLIDAISFQGHIWTCGEANQIVAWDCNTWQIAAVLPGHEGRVTRLCVVDTAVLSSGLDGRIIRWTDINAKGEVIFSGLPECPLSSVFLFDDILIGVTDQKYSEVLGVDCILPRGLSMWDGHIVCGGAVTGIRLWEMSRSPVVFAIDSPAAYCYRVKGVPSGALVVAKQTMKMALIKPQTSRTHCNALFTVPYVASWVHTHSPLAPVAKKECVFRVARQFPCALTEVSVDDPRTVMVEYQIDINNTARFPLTVNTRAVVSVLVREWSTEVRVDGRTVCTFNHSVPVVATGASHHPQALWLCDEWFPPAQCLVEHLIVLPGEGEPAPNMTQEISEGKYFRVELTHSRETAALLDEGVRSFEKGRPLYGTEYICRFAGGYFNTFGRDDKDTAVWPPPLRHISSSNGDPHNGLLSLFGRLVGVSRTGLLGSGACLAGRATVVPVDDWELLHVAALAKSWGCKPRAVPALAMTSMLQFIVSGNPFKICFPVDPRGNSFPPRTGLCSGVSYCAKFNTLSKILHVFGAFSRVDDGERVLEHHGFPCDIISSDALTLSGLRWCLNEKGELFSDDPSVDLGCCGVVTRLDFEELRRWKLLDPHFES